MANGAWECPSHRPGVGQAGQTQELQPDPTKTPDHQPNSWTQGKPEVKLGSQPIGQCWIRPGEHTQRQIQPSDGQ